MSPLRAEVVAGADSAPSLVMTMDVAHVSSLSAAVHMIVHLYESGGFFSMPERLEHLKAIQSSIH